MLRETPGSRTLRSPPASGLGEAGSVYTCHEGGGGRTREPQPSPKLLSSSREGAAGAELCAGGSAGTGRAGGGRGGDDDSLPRPVPGVAKEEAVRFGRRRRLPRTRRGTGQSPEPAGPQSRHLPAAPGSAADRCPLARRGSGGWAGSPHPVPPQAWLGERSSGAYLARPGRPRWAWLRGPGRNWLPRGRTGYSDAELVRAEGNRLTALSAKQRHGRPPGVSALPRNPHPITLRPLPPPPPPPPPPPRRPPAHSTHSPIMQRGNRCCHTSLPGAGG